MDGHVVCRAAGRVRWKFTIVIIMPVYMRQAADDRDRILAEIEK